MIAFSSSLRNNKDWDIYVSATDGGNKRMVVKGSKGSWMALDWSPDQTRLLVKQWVSATRQGLFVAELGGSAAVSTGSTGSTGLHPLDCGGENDDIAVGVACWADDGSGVFFTSSRGSEFQTLRYVMLRLYGIDIW